MPLKLIEKGLVELPESKCPQKIGITNDPKYCRYHRIISRPITKCKIFKERVMQFAKEVKITLREKDTEELD